MMFSNCRDNFKNKVERALCWYLKRFVTSENILKTRSKLGTAEKERKNENNVSIACIVTVFEPILNCPEQIENKFSKSCIVMVLETIWNCRKRKMKG